MYAKKRYWTHSVLPDSSVRADALFTTGSHNFSSEDCLNEGQAFLNENGLNENDT